MLLFWYNPCQSDAPHLLVGHGVVPPKEARGDEIRHNHIYSVVVVGQKNAKNSNSTQGPTDPVVPPETLGRIWKWSQK